MNLDEAIKHCEEVASRMFDDQVHCIKCAEEHKQLAEWLRDYKRLKEQEPNKDAISRQALISHIENQSREWGEDYDAQQILGDIEDMPSVKPQTGHWILTSDDDYEYCTCSECGYQNGENWMIGSQIKFCQECGARMEVEQNDTNSRFNS